MKTIYPHVSAFFTFQQTDNATAAQHGKNDSGYFLKTHYHIKQIQF